jgi:hypothetical protein
MRAPVRALLRLSVLRGARTAYAPAAHLQALERGPHPGMREGLLGSSGGGTRRDTGWRVTHGAPRPNRRARWRRTSMGLVFFAAMAGPASSTEYRLGSDDRIRLLVHEWRSARSEAFAWTPLNGEFTVGARGTVSLPLIGEVKAEGLTTEELGPLISETLQKTIGLRERPSTSVEIARYRPIYVTGDVGAPGEFPYRPGLTVLKALALAGGIYRATGVTLAGLEREATLARGDLRVLRAERIGLLARRARLRAEASDEASCSNRRGHCRT